MHLGWVRATLFGKIAAELPTETIVITEPYLATGKYVGAERILPQITI